MKPSPVLMSLLEDIRQHPGFEELKRTVGKPRLTPFRSSDAEKVESARARWIYQSGQIAQHNQWLAILTGEPQETE